MPSPPSGQGALNLDTPPDGSPVAPEAGAPAPRPPATAPAPGTIITAPELERALGVRLAYSPQARTAATRVPLAQPPRGPLRRRRRRRQKRRAPHGRPAIRRRPRLRRHPVSPHVHRPRPPRRPHPPIARMARRHRRPMERGPQPLDVPSGATLSFGYLQTSNHRYRYGSTEFQFVGFDELTEFPEDDYTFLFSRLRKPTTRRAGAPRPARPVPLRMRGATNPGGRGHAWVKRRFIDQAPAARRPRRHASPSAAPHLRPRPLADNPHIDHDSYIENLGNLTRVDRERLLGGDWDVDLGDRYYDQPGIDAALAHGQELDYLLERGDEAGEPSTSRRPRRRRSSHRHRLGRPRVLSHRMAARGRRNVRRRRRPAAGARARRRDQPRPRRARQRPAWPGAPRVRDPLDLLEDVRYDAAGLQSQRTFNAIARRRRPGLKATKIPFGNYKREAGLYARLLARARRRGPPHPRPRDQRQRRPPVPRAATQPAPRPRRRGAPAQARPQHRRGGARRRPGRALALLAPRRRPQPRPRRPAPTSLRPAVRAGP
jgi:hypothetical protein